MIIRKAEEKDIPRILELLGQVLQIHADIRPDIFIPATTKYKTDELAELLKNEEKPIYVAADDFRYTVYAVCRTIQITASDMGVKLYTDFGFVHNGNFMQYKL